jgi:hypothetical protein
MFTVRWVIREKESEPVESERFQVGHVETLVTASRYRMATMQLKYPEAQPDGFIILDDDGKEIGRWFDTAALP